MALPCISRIHNVRDARFSQRLRDIGLNLPAIRGGTEPGDDLRSPLTPTRETLFSDAPPAIALRLLFCAVPVAEDEAGRALGDDLFHTLAEAGLLAPDPGGGMIAPFHLRTAAGLFLFSDYLGSDGDAVMGAGETTAVLYHAAKPRIPVTGVLDLGCGAGTLALLLAREAKHAVGTDINPRAVAMARLNAAINGVHNAEFRQGDLFEPVENEQFDLIVSQPPYYPDPAGAASIFLHGGKRGDELAARVMLGLSRHLTPAGRALVFTSWPQGPPSLEQARMRVLELRTSRRELNGARQSISVVEHAGDGQCWPAVFEVSAECWGNVEPARIDQIIAAQQLLRAPAADLLSAALRMPAGASVFMEGSQIFLRCPAEALTGVVALDESTLRIITAVHNAPDLASAIEPSALATVRAAIARGLLVPAPR
ncbi:MAG: methyltransferase [Bryobacteraceae bacterium]|nr:methyltransferase [Bryobacteraceae bacterium]